MQTVVISLKRSTARRSRVERELADTGLDFAFLEATDSAQADFQHAERSNAALTKKRKGYVLTAGELACFSSHLRAWERCVEANERFLILEDNVELSHTVPADAIRQLIAAIPSIEYVKLAALSRRRSRRCSILSDTHTLVRYTRGTCGTSAYLISPEGARKLIAGADEFLESVDDYMEKPWRHQVIAHSVHPSIFQRAGIESTIGSDRKQKGRRTLISKLYIELYRIHESIMNGIYLFR